MHVDPAAFALLFFFGVIFLFFFISLFFFYFHAKAGVSGTHRHCPPQALIGRTGLEDTTFRMVSEVDRAGVQAQGAWLVLAVEIPHVRDTGGELTAVTHLLPRRPRIISIHAYCVDCQTVFPGVRDFINSRDFTVIGLIGKEQ